MKKWLFKVIRKALNKRGPSRLLKYFVDLVLWPHDLKVVFHGYRFVFKEYPNIFFPRTINELICQKKLFDRKPLYSVIADKLACKTYVAEALGTKYVPKILWQGSCLFEARQINLPNKFVIKVNHNSGGVIPVFEKTTLNWKQASDTCNKWLSQNYSRDSGEWQYRWILPTIFIEEFIEPMSDSVPEDYKFWCFQGQAAFVQVDVGRFKNHQRALFDSNFQRLSLRIKYPQAPASVCCKTPECNEMKKLAEVLCRGFDFVRVDFFCGQSIKVGELTLHPGGGTEVFDPPDWGAYFLRMYYKNL
jgi:hypothetical protein